MNDVLVYIWLYGSIYGYIPGTNNARLGGMLRQLAMYYHKDANNLFLVRLAQVSFLCTLTMHTVLPGWVRSILKRKLSHSDLSRVCVYSQGCLETCQRDSFPMIFNLV